MDTFITFFSYANGGAGLGILALYGVLEVYLSDYYKTKFKNKWIRFGIPAFLAYLGVAIICFILSQDIRVFIYPIVLPVITVLLEVYQSNQKPNPLFPANKDEEKRRYPLRCFDVVFVFVVVFLMHLLLRAVI
ncbi:hypothetical protein SAMN05660649_04207 [Desulfotomaculum arcticum]|uniref:Uncharacterized protein n=1 Tax=Desulfotruncus arcticus DSM 17038 TaxID=1121424 RepID=A0A1I2Y375_9FIRM|nr:hypothetical protein [Desulfotruncus arcticus]SFH18781.1 hypothetical protein SAMN05660649_04207 [Desulfotomaculum arcticum] [Desulfotruncus arcticus DSM 17038]